MNTPAYLSPQMLKVFETMPERYLILSPELVILTASNAYLEATGTQREKITGRNLWSVFPEVLSTAPPKAVEDLKASLEQVRHTKLAHQITLRLNPRSAGSEEKYEQIRNTPVLDDQGNIQYFIHQVQEITELVKQQQSLEQLQERVTLLSPQVPTGASPHPPEDGETKELLEAVFNASMVGIAVFKSVRDEAGEIIDFTYQLVNPVVEKIAGRPLVGCRYVELYPFVRESGIFAAFVRVVESGEPFDFEQHYQADGFSNWFRMTAVKQDDGLVSTVEDITGRKQTETESIKTLKLLQQTEEVARMGSWEYDRATGTFKWSEGMYRLFGLPVGSPVRPETYLDYVIEEDQAIGQRIVTQLRQGEAPVEESLRLRVKGQTLTFRINSVTLGDREKVLGVDLDISEVKRLEEENLQMRLNQQKALLLAILEAQEEERRRISEALHNGVGQILYATKLSLDQVVRLVPRGALQSTEKLLKEAINETRRVSHELVPMVLKDFGLKDGILDLCRNYQTSTFQLNCQVAGISGRLESYLEIALYRFSQELVNNIVKHAQATEATLLLHQHKDKILLQVEDNGKGISLGVDKQGLGLRSIRDRIKLLNGTLSITTPPQGTGTQVIIQIPV